MSLTPNSKFSHSHTGDQTSSSEESAIGDLQFVEPHADEDTWKRRDRMFARSFPQESIESDFGLSAYSLYCVLSDLASVKLLDPKYDTLNDAVFEDLLKSNAQLCDLLNQAVKAKDFKQIRCLGK